MTSNQKPPKAGPFYKTAFAFGRNPGKEAWIFLAGFCALSYAAGCWLYTFPDKSEPFVIIPFLIISIISLFPIYIYGTKSALEDDKTQNYLAYFTKKEFWYVGSVQAFLMLAFGLAFTGLEMLLELFVDAKFLKGGANAVQLFVGAFTAFILTHVASGRSLSISKILKASALAFAPSIGLYALFFLVPVFFVTILEIFFVIHKNFNMVVSAFFHSVLMGVLGYFALCGSVAFGKLYQVTTKDV